MNTWLRSSLGHDVLFGAASCPAPSGWSCSASIFQIATSCSSGTWAGYSNRGRGARKAKGAPVVTIFSNATEALSAFASRAKAA